MKYRASTCIQFLLVVLALLCLSLYIVGIVHYLAGSDDESIMCDLPYISKYPEFVRIRMENEIEVQYPGFGLYVYGEGDGAEKLRQMEYSGVPVLFVPGHAGSHRQIRYIASASLKMSLDRRTAFHFDYFTISLAEGLSAFSRGVIEKQTDFVSICIRHVLSLYNGTVDQIVVIGHSMGGVVAKAALLRVTSSNFTLASVLMNLASPYTPLVAFEKTFSNYYENVNNYESRVNEMGTSIIAIGGGPRDHMVATSHMIDPHADLNVLSTAIPNVWRSADHLSILWCRQFVIALVRALFDSAEVHGRIAKISSKSENKLRALRYHLSDRYATEYLTQFETKINFETHGEWIEITSPSYNFDIENDGNNEEEHKLIYLMIPLRNKSFSHLSLDTINLEASDWLFICSASILKNNSKACKWGWNLTNRTIVSPDFQDRIRKTVDLEFKTLEEFSEETHIVIRIPMSEARKKFPPIIYIDMYSRDARQIHINSVGFAWLPPSLGNIIAGSKDTVIDIFPGTLRYFVDITTIPDAIYIKLNAITDNNGNNSSGYTVIQMKEQCNNPNSAISQFHTFQEKDIGRRRTLHLQTGMGTSDRLNIAEMIISFDPRFRYSIEIGRAGITDRMANFIKNRTHRLYPTIMSELLLFMVARIDKSQYCIPITFGIIFIASIIFDICLEICVALCILSILTVVICWAVIFIGTIIHNVTARFLTTALARFPPSWYDGLICQRLNQLPLIAIILLIIFISSRCGALVMVLSALLYFLKLCCIYKVYLENSLLSSLRNFMRNFRKFNKHKSINEQEMEDENINSTEDIMNHLLLVMIWFLTAGSAVPSILVWAKNFSYEIRLFSEDPTMLASWIVLTTWCSLGFVKLPIIIDYHCYRVDPITLIQRILGWPLLWIAGSNNPVYYQWMIPPIVSLFISCHYLRQHCLYLRHCNPRFPELKNV